MKIKTYAFELKSDTGSYFVRVYASSWKSAINIVCDWQKCPKRAIINKHIVKESSKHRAI